MKTTLTLDDDLAAQLEERAETLNLSFKQVVNDTLRRGLDVEEPPKKRPGEFRTFPGGFAPGIDPNRLRQLDQELELEWMVNKMKKNR